MSVAVLSRGVGFEYIYLLEGRMNQRVALQQLGNMRGGYPARRPPETRARQGWTPVLQAGDIRSDGSIPWDELCWVEAKPFPEKYVISEGDVLLPLRAQTPRAVVARSVPNAIIAVGHWALITPHRHIVTPSFLAWYLNHPLTTARLFGLMRGTKLKFLSLTALRDFEIELPPLEVQHRIARAHALNARVTELERQLAGARKQLVDTLTMAALRGAVEPETDS